MHLFISKDEQANDSEESVAAGSPAFHFFLYLKDTTMRTAHVNPSRRKGHLPGVVRPLPVQFKMLPVCE